MLLEEGFLAFLCHFSMPLSSFAEAGPFSEVSSDTQALDISLPDEQEK